MKSAIYQGWVRHRRLNPVLHSFRYRVFMMYLRLDELPSVFAGVPFWSARRPALAWFRRKDYMGDTSVPLDQAVRDRVEHVTGTRPRGPIYLLTNLRYFGFVMNPISCYYCFSEDESTVEHLVAEVNNTPWNERHSYVLSADSNSKWLRCEFAKDFHVSPFHPMDMTYRWHSNTPTEKLCLNLANYESGEKAFDATLSLRRRPLRRGTLLRLLASHPFMTLKVGAAIYFEAMRLWLKGVPFYSHPPETVSSTNE